uniref:tRNA-5-taurinomethyluridine 2-sulfurtransferase n=1 Tax=Globodera pallida TaxID=36090 RepID=A0A183CBE8_GLOPA
MVIRRVVCAVSGGVDSALSAFLLKRRGFDVVGVHMTNWDPQDESGDSSSCPQTEDLADSEKLCDYLGIKLHVVNFVKQYWNEVFVAFENFGADALATGHFAKTSQGDFLENNLPIGQKDALKDQTYFLSSLSHCQLDRVMFPSTGICFIGRKRKFGEFLCKYIDSDSGPLIDIDTGMTISGIRHKGIHNFTIGKRLRMENCIGCLEKLSPHGDALYVAGIDQSSRSVYLCAGNIHPKLFSKRVLVSSPVWISGEPPKELHGQNRLQCLFQRTILPIPCALYSHQKDDRFFELEFGFARAVLRIACNDSFPGHIRNAASVSLKNFVRTNWSGDGDAPLAEDEREQIRSALLETMFQLPSYVRPQMIEIVCQISKVDFPDRWPQLIQLLSQHLQAATAFDQLSVSLGTLEQLISR